MRNIIRVFVYSFIALYVTQAIVGGFSFGENGTFSILLITFGIGLLMLFMKPILKMVSVSTKGFSFLVMNFVLTLVTIYLLTVFVPDFEIRATTIKLLNLGLPTVDLTMFWSLFVSSLLASIITAVLSWLNGK